MILRLDAQPPRISQRRRQYPSYPHGFLLRIRNKPCAEPTIPDSDHVSTNSLQVSNKGVKWPGKTSARTEEMRKVDDVPDCKRRSLRSHKHPGYESVPQHEPNSDLKRGGKQAHLLPAGIRTATLNAWGLRSHGKKEDLKSFLAPKRITSFVKKPNAYAFRATKSSKGRVFSQTGAEWSFSPLAIFFPKLP